MSTRRIWTFGHSTREAGETVAMLREFGVHRVADVRTIRGSRHNPQFGAEEMTGWLQDAGIGYHWISRLGGRRGKQAVDPDVNADWTHRSFHSYADYALSGEFAAGLAELTELADAPTAIMCAEAVPWRCHRSLIATALTARLARDAHSRPGAWRGSRHRPVGRDTADRRGGPDHLSGERAARPMSTGSLSRQGGPGEGCIGRSRWIALAGGCTLPGGDGVNSVWHSADGNGVIPV